MNKLGRLLRAAREKKHLSMSALGKASGISHSLVSQCEGEGKALPVDRVEAIADALNLEGQERISFVFEAYKTKAHAITEVRPYLEIVEKKLAATTAFLNSLSVALIKDGEKLPQTLVDQVDALNELL